MIKKVKAEVIVYIALLVIILTMSLPIASKLLNISL